MQRRHDPSFFETTLVDRQALLGPIDRPRGGIDGDCPAAERNIGVDDGTTLVSRRRRSATDSVEAALQATKREISSTVRPAAFRFSSLW